MKETTYRMKVDYFLLMGMHMLINVLIFGYGSKARAKTYKDDLLTFAKSIREVLKGKTKVCDYEADEGEKEDGQKR